MSLFAVDKEKCKSCGLCALVCPVQLIKFDKRGDIVFQIIKFGK